MKGPALFIIVGGATLITVSAVILILFFGYGFLTYRISPYHAPEQVQSENWDAILRIPLSVS